MRVSVFSIAFLSCIGSSLAIWGEVNENLFGSFFGVPLTNATYDYIIVGGGTAGLTVAGRLAENKSLSIAIIEPGSFFEFSNGNLSQIPYYSERYVSKDPTDVQPLIDWELVTIPQPQLDGQRIHYAQGRGLGGSSYRNQLIYHRGTVGSYDRWAQLVGDPGFSWSEMFPHFQKSVNFTPPNYSKRAANTSTLSYLESAYSPTGGPLHVSFSNYGSPISTYAQTAFAAAGFPVAKDFSSGVLNGSQWNPFTIDPATQARSSSETSFLQAMLKNASNVQIYQNTKAMNVLFNSAKQAVGVDVTTLGTPYQLMANKEVIVSAGVMHSPQLLMVSGIGPRATLEKYNITVIADRPGVGQNMHDSCNIGGVTYPVNVISPSTYEANATELAAASYNYLHNQTGFLTNPGGDFLSWEKFPAAYRANLSASTLYELSKLPSDWPEVEYVMNSASGSLTATTSTGVNTATLGALLIATSSRGNITICSSSMNDKPLISTNWLSTTGDQEQAIQAYRRARDVWSHMGSVVIGSEITPGANVTSDADLLAYIRSDGISAIHHATSTNMMGMANETMAVVDPHGRVYGVSGLRVIDSSSFRFTPPGHTQGATYAHAEKLVSDIILGY